MSILLLILSCCFIALTLAECPNNAIESASMRKCFVTVSTPMTFEGAQTLCRTFGGRLAVIDNARDNSLVAEAAQNRIAKAKLNAQQIWIGVINGRRNESCSLDANTECPYANWATDQHQPCALLDTKSGFWSIGNCSQEFPFTCEVLEVTARRISPRAAPSCPRKWSMWRQNCYKLNYEEKSWEEAEKVCASQGAHLASIHSRLELEYLIEEFKPPNLTPRVWLGGKRDHTSAGQKYKWNDGSAWDYEFWGPNFGGDGACVSTASAVEFVDEKWDTFDCSSQAFFYCKKSAV